MMKIRLIVRHTVKPKNPVRKVVKTVKYTANPDGTVSTSSSKKVIQYDNNGSVPSDVNDASIKQLTPVIKS